MKPRTREQLLAEWISDYERGHIGQPETVRRAMEKRFDEMASSDRWDKDSSYCVDWGMVQEIVRPDYMIIEDGEDLVAVLPPPPNWSTGPFLPTNDDLCDLEMV